MHLCKADAFDSLLLSALRTRLRDQAGVQVRAAGKVVVHPAGSEAWQQAGNRWRLKVVLGVPLFFREMPKNCGGLRSYIGLMPPPEPCS